MAIVRLVKLLVTAAALESFDCRAFAPIPNQQHNIRQRKKSQKTLDRPSIQLKVSNWINPPPENSDFLRGSSLWPLNATAAVASSVLVDEDDFNTRLTNENDKYSGLLDQFMSSHWGPRAMLGVIACIYATNFPLGSIMNAALPASAATSGRFFLASLALSPWIRRIDPSLAGMAVLTGCFTASGYITQSLALMDTPAATVSFLGAATVIWCPFLEWLMDRKPSGWNDRPQTWLAAGLCMTGVGILEMCNPGILPVADETASTAASFQPHMGDALAILQAVGFGTGVYLSERMVHKQPQQALPITAVIVATTALISCAWAFADGWMFTDTGAFDPSLTFPGLLMDSSMQNVAGAVVWTGLLSTSLNFGMEIFTLSKVPSGEASVILASEPLWAALFAGVLLGESLGWNDYVGGFLIVAACLINSIPAEKIQSWMTTNKEA